jgi:hypothetical protein
VQLRFGHQPTLQEQFNECALCRWGSHDKHQP